VTGTLASVMEVQDYFVKMQDSDAEAPGSFVEMRDAHIHSGLYRGGTGLFCEDTEL